MAKGDLKYLGLYKEELETFEPPLKQYLPKEIWGRKSIVSMVMDEISGLDPLADPEVCELRMERLGLSVAPEELRERVILRERGKIAIAGIRFKNLDPNFPFIELHANFSISRYAYFTDLIRTARKEFASCAPKGATFWDAPGIEGRGIDRWAQVMFGETRSPMVFELPSRLGAEFSRSFAYFDRYESEYQAWQAENPELAPFLRIESPEDLQAAARAGQLMNLFDESGWAGVIAGESRKLYGVSGLYIFEIFLSRRLRGQKLARALQWRFIKGLSSKHRYVWGHIFAGNLPSLKTAQSLGRRAIQSEYFIPFK